MPLRRLYAVVELRPLTRKERYRLRLRAWLRKPAAYRKKSDRPRPPRRR